ncbi:hypothetical protein V1525DRAFT_121760 [Lipomyces kononenkoae]|uniref:Uncharacterized protein n=1 Tax=Lipomyces kononenkoae TaxID=34357 RepID=A0ACC3T3A0_LIPKO
MSPGTIGNIIGMAKESLSNEGDTNATVAGGRTTTSGTVNSGSDLVRANDPSVGGVLDNNSPINTQTMPGLGESPSVSNAAAAVVVRESATFVESDHVPHSLKQFVDEKPNERYIFDGDDHQTKLCRFEENGKKCLNLAAPTKDVLSQMQKLDFYCALGPDVGRSEFECRKIL